MHYWSRETGHRGEAAWEEIRAWVDQGTLSPDTVLSLDGEDWHPFATVEAGDGFIPAPAPRPTAASESEAPPAPSSVPKATPPPPQRHVVGAGARSIRWCPRCGDFRLAERNLGISDNLGCVLIILTAGLFIPIFIVLRLLNSSSPHRCLTCGGLTKASP